MQKTLEHYAWYPDGLPWQFVTPISVQMERQPTLLLGEFTFYLTALAALAHAISNGRKHVLLLVCSLVSGTLNDVFFMVLPFVDNFWHAQCTVMISARLPLYILCVYVAFVYFPCVGVWRLSDEATSPFGKAAVAALGAGVFYSVYDIVGAKFLWWTWHHSDAAIFERWCGVPVGSTMWTVVHVFVFYLLFHCVVLRRNSTPLTVCLQVLLVTSFLTTPLMMLLFGIFQLHQLRVSLWPEVNVATLPGKPDFFSLSLVILSMLCFIGTTSWPFFTRGLKAMRPRSWRLDRLSAAIILIYFITLACIMIYGNPAAVVSTGIHQEIGPCNVTGRDLSGYERYEYLCLERLRGEFKLDCVPQTMPPEVHPSWFTVCGTEHVNYALYVSLTILLSFVGASLFLLMFYCPHAELRSKSD